MLEAVAVKHSAFAKRWMAQWDAASSRGACPGEWTAAQGSAVRTSVSPGSTATTVQRVSPLG
jgi:hypothetical protein